jgi:nitrite reductase/ring-hydroxylating ferredoxin subunit
MADAGDKLVALGTLSAVPTALTGLTDYSTISDRAIRTASVHGLLNAGALALYGLSLVGRRRGARGPAMALSGVALGLITFSAWLGGEMTYKYRIAVNKSERPKGPTEWQAVLAEADLGDRQPHRVEVEGAPVLVYRDQHQIYAIGAVCGHEGGPLEKGKFEGACVECPWHQSVYDLRNGRVVHGPTTYPVPNYETRLRNGRLEVRLPQAQQK